MEIVAWLGDSFWWGATSGVQLLAESIGRAFGLVWVERAGLLVGALLLNYYSISLLPIKLVKNFQLFHPIIFLGKYLTGLEHWLYPLPSKPPIHQITAPKDAYIDFFKGIGYLLLGLAPLGLWCWFWQHYQSAFMFGLVNLARQHWAWTNFFSTAVLYGVSLLLVMSLTAWLLAMRGLVQHVEGVAQALAKLEKMQKPILIKQQLHLAQKMLQHIVSRDTKKLNQHGVARSSLESLSENFSDAVIAPSCWFLVGGLTGLVFYKIINTMDSMVGYRNDRYEYFGKAAAKLDDLVNYIPARLTAGLYFLLWCWREYRRRLKFQSQAPTNQTKPMGFCMAWQQLMGQAKTHASPNSGWGEAGLAWYLQVQLGGRRYYPNVGGKKSLQNLKQKWLVKTQYLGFGRKNLMADDVWAGLAVTKAGFFLWLGLVATMGLFGGLFSFCLSWF